MAGCSFVCLIFGEQKLQGEQYVSLKIRGGRYDIVMVNELSKSEDVVLVLKF
jgi:hypothetical protein